MQSLSIWHREFESSRCVSRPIKATCVLPFMEDKRSSIACGASQRTQRTEMPTCNRHPCSESRSWTATNSATSNQDPCCIPWPRRASTGNDLLPSRLLSERRVSAATTCSSLLVRSKTQSTRLKRTADNNGAGTVCPVCIGLGNGHLISKTCTCGLKKANLWTRRPESSLRDPRGPEAR